MLGFQTASYAFLIGFVPAFIWLAFWLLQDKKHPEPPWLIVRAFAAGTLAVVLVIPLQKLAAEYVAVSFLLVFVWASIEELTKFAIAWFAVLRHRAVDEPLDFPIYLITVALGFAALENALFLLTPLSGGQFEHALVTGNLRFIGATLIHVLSSASIGLFLAFAYYKKRWEKLLYGAVGVILAAALHALFNFSIINTNADWLLMVFVGVWVGVVFLLLMLEKIKLLKRPAWWKKVFIKK